LDAISSSIELSFFLGKSQVKIIQRGKLFGIILPIVFVVVVTAIALYVCKKRRSQRIKLPHGSKSYILLGMTL